MDGLLTLICGTILGAVLTGSMQIFADYRKRIVDGNVITQAVVAEVDATITLMKSRNYREAITARITSLENNENERLQMSIVMPDQHSPVYWNNINNLGLIKGP
ncbi:MAG TPA: hypothetical protein PKI32_05150, partial [Opitutales bacterium]|nr:hypothetical protein [Opitutales bacterium]